MAISLKEITKKSEYYQVTSRSYYFCCVRIRRLANLKSNIAVANIVTPLFVMVQPKEALQHVRLYQLVYTPVFIVFMSGTHLVSKNIYATLSKQSS